MPFHKGFLPREGFCLDVILKIIRGTALNPSLILPLLLLARYTRRGEDLAILHPTAHARLRTLFCLGVARVLSNWFSDKVRNNWVDDKYDWQDREIVLVTGGSSGIGGAVVRLFDELGVKVVVLDVQSLTYEASSNVHYYKCDLRSPQSVNATADKIRAEVGHPTVIINNAGVARGKTLLDSTPADIRFTFDVNALAHYWVVQAFLPEMVATNHGTIATVSSYASWLTIPSMIDYGASKAAALSFHEGLTAELQRTYGATRVRTVSVHPGHTTTPLFQGYDQKTAFVMPELQPDTIAEAIVNKILTGRSGSVIVPEAGAMLPLLRFFPDWYSVPVRAKSDSYMSMWKGKQVIKDVDASYEGDGRNPSTKAKGDAPGPDESTVLVPKGGDGA